MCTTYGHINPRWDAIIRERHDVFPVYSKFECVYFVRSHDFIKIGSTGYLWNRLNALKVDNVLPELIGLFIRKNCRTLERRIHDKFVKYRVRGEWFYYNKEIIDFIDLHMNDYDKTGFPVYKEYVNNYQEFFNRKMNKIDIEMQREYEENEWIRS